MEKGFSFNIDLCVACHACIAACSLENDMEMPVRKLWADKADTYPGLPVHNISMACNHCLEAPCLSACPAKAYYRDKDTGAVRLRSERCIGCSYCYWNCPYDAPQYNSNKRIVEKCHLCNDRLLEGVKPACVTACPTGALSFCETDDAYHLEEFPASITEPRLRMEGTSGNGGMHLKIIPQSVNSLSAEYRPEQKINPLREWSLIIFTYLSSLLFAFNISNWSGRLTTGVPLYLGLVLLSMIIPLVHLGKPQRAWRSLTGILLSPLSNEITALLLFAISSSLAYLYNISQLWLVSFVSGFLLLISIDSVYTYADRRFIFKLHPGQAFLSGLFMASFFLQESLPFIFVGILKTILSIYYYYQADKSNNQLIINIIQFMVFIFLLLSFIGIVDFTVYGIILLLISELSGRIFYYFHFSADSYLIKYYVDKFNKYEKETN